MRTTQYTFFYLLLFFAPFNRIYGQQNFVWSICGGGGYTRWVDVVKNVTFYDASGNVIDNVQVKSVGSGPSVKLQSKILYQMNGLQIGLGVGFQRDLFNYYNTESEISGLIEIDTTYISNAIYELEYYLIGGFNLFKTEFWSGNLNLNVGSYFLHSDYQNEDIKRKINTGVECELNYLIIENWALQINPKYEYEFLSLDEPLRANPNWSIHNISASIGLCKTF